MGRRPKNIIDLEEEQETTTKNASSSILANLLNENKEDHLNFTERVSWKISSGSFLIDLALGGGIEPSLIRLCGANNEGKTPQTLEIIRNFLETVPDSRAFWVLAEGRLSRQNKERCGLKFVTKESEWEDGTVFVLESNIYEFIINTIRELVLNNPENKKFAFVIDSLDGVVAKGDRDKKAQEATKVAGPQVLSKKMMQSLSLGMFKYGHLMILISQVTAEIKLDPYSKAPNRGGNFSGGNSLLHQSDFILEYEPSFPSDIILDNPSGKLNDGKSKAIGKYARVILQKSAEETTRKQRIIYPIKFGKRPSGIWVEYEIIDMLLANSFAFQKGAWITLDDNLFKELTEKVSDEVPKQFNGEGKLRTYLEENSKVTNYLFKKFKDLLTM